MESYNVMEFDCDGRRSQLQKFISLPFDLYKNDKKWIPPFKSQLYHFLRSSHPYRSFIRQRHFLVESANGASIIGRAAAFVNNKFTLEGKPLGSIGLFECREDFPAAELLVKKACQWLKEQGVSTVWAPMDGTIWKAYRFMTGGFQDYPFYREPYNKPYYPLFFEKAGFEVLKKWYSFRLTLQDWETLQVRCQKKYQRACEMGYRFRTLQMNRFEEELLLLHHLITDSYSDFTGFHPLDSSTFVQEFKSLKHLCLPEFFYFAIDPGGKPVGFFVILPDYQGAIRAMKGSKSPWAQLKFYLDKKKPSALLTLYLGIIHREIKRRTGIGSALFYLGTDRALKTGIPIIEPLIAEDSHSNVLTSPNPFNRHEYALYHKPI